MYINLLCNFLSCEPERKGKKSIHFFSLFYASIHFFPYLTLSMLSSIVEKRMEQNIIAGIVFLIIGVIFEVFTTSLWRLCEKWKSKDGKAPSSSYVVLIRTLGALIILLGLLLLSGAI